MPALSKKDKLRLLKTILESRHADLREQNLNRQGKGHFHVSGMGHEALAAISILLGPDDYVVPYYRDRGLVLGRGMTTREIEGHLKEIYGVEVSPGLISQVTEAVNELGPLCR